jgi:Asp-tRNA(Asn)/Glu-tRNA(Gln) amidotransferase A subunit family amidase
VGEILAANLTHPSVRAELTARAALSAEERNRRCDSARRNAARLRDGLRRALWQYRLDAFVYPTWSNAARLIGDLNSPAGANANRLAPAVGFPAITVPMGTIHGGLPVGLELVADSWMDWKLIALAYSFEQAAKLRRAPSATTPR